MLNKIPLFACLSETELATLSRAAVTRRITKNTLVISEGDTTDALYIIQSGTVRVTKTNESGKEIVIAMLSEDEYFGEMALLDERPRSANIVAKTDCELMMIRKPDFRRVLNENPQLAFDVMLGLCEKLRSANNSIESLALMDVYGRLARTLLELAKPDADGNLVIAESLTHKELANMVGSSREMVSRIMKDLVSGGYITVDHHHISIHQSLPRQW